MNLSKIFVFVAVVAMLGIVCLASGVSAVGYLAQSQISANSQCSWKVCETSTPGQASCSLGNCNAYRVGYTESGACVCGYSTDGRCASESQCTGSKTVQYTRTINGVEYEIYTCRCPLCGNTFTGKRLKPAPTPTPVPTVEIDEHIYEEERITQTSGFMFNAYPPFCSLSAYPAYTYPGYASEITVQFFNLFYPPWAVFVDCGNGYSAYAYGCYGTTGFCYAQCPYPQVGTYYANAYAASTFCYPTVVHVVPGGVSTPTPTASPSSTPTPTVYPESCDTTTNPSVITGSGSSTVRVSYYNMESTPNGAVVICGNGQSVSASCSGTEDSGTCVGTCKYATPASYPTFYSVDSIVNGVYCDPAGVTIVSGTPTATATPLPSNLQVIVRDAVTGNPISNALVIVNNEDTYYTEADGTVYLADINAGDYQVYASKAGYTPKSATTHVDAGETQTLIMELDPILDRSCATTVNPATVRAGSSSTVSVNFAGFTAAPSLAQIDCGNGQAVVGTCTYAGGSGVCAAQCSYGTEQAYPVFYTVKSSLDGTQCSSANVKVVAELPTTGGLLMRVTECDSGAAIQSATVDIDGPTEPATPTTYYTDQYGQALAGSLPAGDYAIEASKKDYDSARASGTVFNGKTTTVSMCLPKASESCDFGAQIIRSPICPYSENPQPYQLKLTSNIDEEQTISLIYSNPAISGPATVYLAARMSTIVDLTSSTLPDFAGGNYVMVSLVGTTCTKNIQIAACQSGGLSVEAVESSKTGFGGTRVCYPLIVRNMGLGHGLVTMSAAITGASENYVTQFTPSSFVITPQESKNVEFCVDIPSGASGAPSFVIRATSPINDATATVSLTVPGSSLFTTNATQCMAVDSRSTLTTVAIAITNNALSGDYDVVLADNNLTARTQDKIYNFVKGTTRVIYVDVDAYGKFAGDHRFDMYLKRDGVVVFQQNLCFRVLGEQRLYAQLTPNTMTVARNSGKSAFLSLKNLGTVRTIYRVAVNSQLAGVTVTPSTVSLNAGEETTVEIHAAPGAAASLGAYTIPVNVYLSDYYTYTQNPYPSPTTYSSSISFDCGNGQTSTQTCSGTSGYCQMTCTYNYAGTFYPQVSSIGGTTCTNAAMVRVTGSYPDNTCYIDTHSASVEHGTSNTVTVRYYNMASISASSNVYIYCGNGNTRFISCSGTSGSCSATCDYPSTGVYTVSGSVGGISCADARVAVTDENTRSCAVTNEPANILTGQQSTIYMDYFNIPNNYYGGGGTYYGEALLDSQNLLVTVVATLGTTPNYEPDESTAFQLVTPQGIELPPTGGVRVPIVVRNNNYYAITNAMIVVKGLPDGVGFSPVAAFSLDPNGERTVYMDFVSKDAAIGTYSLSFQAQSAIANSPKKSVQLKISMPSAGELSTGTQQGAVVSIVEDDVPKIRTSFVLTNNEAGAVSLTARMSLPQGWTYSLAPASVTLVPGQTAELNAAITPVNFDPNAKYNATLFLQSSDGKTKSARVNTQPGSVGLLSLGFFTLALGQNAGIIVLVLLVCAGAYMLFIANRNLKESETVTGEETTILKEEKRK
ncbi:hypothetical protein COT29_03200 [Candidatus Micrarchaeota archaeon CG08_land_8_20_14_0_20_59_11]|nr:MAG: hypothetical protein COT29_03200 [Candidatus Micrarchaeota archaeon CG08_land_8_20_14_0_20_59_11]